MGGSAPSGTHRGQFNRHSLDPRKKDPILRSDQEHDEPDERNPPEPSPALELDDLVGVSVVHRNTAHRALMRALSVVPEDASDPRPG
jgi:hypothetical protein